MGAMALRRPQRETIEAELERLVDGGLPGAFAYVDDGDGDPTFVTAGVADLETGARMDADQAYRVASTTKTVTAVVVLQLVDEGRLALDDLVQARLPDHAIPNGDRMTIEHLLRMRSGLFDYEDDPNLPNDLEARRASRTLAHAVELALRGPVSFEPGADLAYCNSNYCLLETIVERVTGRSFAAEIRERVIEPIGLTATTYPAEDDLSLPDGAMRGYHRVDDAWIDASLAWCGRGDGGLISTPRDVARLFRALLLEHSLLRPDTLAKMMTVHPTDPPHEIPLFGLSLQGDYGMGLLSQAMSCGRVWGHPGSALGYGHLPFVHLDTGRVAILMRNASGLGQPGNEALEERVRFSTDFRSSLFC
jgi:D-alanyl-D-alanine carboxypeptidase